MYWNLTSSAAVPRVIILANGPLDADALAVLRQRLLPDDVLIAADGGANHAFALQRLPRAVVGDMDSVSDMTMQWLRDNTNECQLLPYPRDKAFTDLELALEFAQSHYPHAQVCIAAATAGRLDMTLANLFLLARHAYGADSGGRPEAEGARLGVQFWDAFDTAFVLNAPGGQLRLGCAGARLSVLALEAPAEGIVTHGTQWALRQERLVFGECRGVSNFMLVDEIGLIFTSGKLLLIYAEIPHDQLIKSE